MIFKDREEAGRLLAKEIKKRNYQSPFVLAIPRGGVVVGNVIAKELNCPLDIVVVKKIGAPGNQELAIGAVGPEETVIWNEEICKQLEVSSNIKYKVLSIKYKERDEKDKSLRGDKKVPDLKDKTVILVDDGIATGATVEVAIKWIKTKNPQKIVIATPVAPPDSIEKLRPLVDDLICLTVESDFWAVGQFYEEFGQVDDEKVKNIISKFQINKYANK